jgi:hypothetical protein
LNTRVLVSDLHYFAPFTFYLELGRSSHCIFDVYENFQKMSFRNRCVIAAANGPVNLTVPLAGGRNQKVLMKDVGILNSEDWQVNHWRTLSSAYNRSPWFHHYSDELERLYSTRFDRLVDWNLACLEWACDKLSIKAGRELTSNFVKEYDPKLYKDWRGRFRPSTISQVAGDYPVYTQVFADRYPFIPNLSVLDYLFCAGPF